MPDMIATTETKEVCHKPVSETIVGSNKASSSEQELKTKKMSVLLKIVIAIVILTLLGGAAFAGYRYWQESRHYETTDDASIDGHISQVASQISGRVQAILVQDNQEVAEGQPLLQIDARDFDIRLKLAKAQRLNAIAQLEQMKAQLSLQLATVDQNKSNIASAEADAVQARQDFKRYSSITPQAVTGQEVDRATATARSTAAKLDAARHGLTAAKAQLDVIRAQIVAAETMVQQNDIQVENAQLQLSYTRIVAAVAGRLTKRTVEVGNYVNPGQALLSVVPTNVWVTANFKETQLSDMVPGQTVDLYLDAYPQKVFAGHIDSFQTGTGSAFSSLPAENATGNYVKVVQRLPVKIIFNAVIPGRFRMAPGLSVRPKVKVR